MQPALAVSHRWTTPTSWACETTPERCYSLHIHADVCPVQPCTALMPEKVATVNHLSAKFNILKPHLKPLPCLVTAIMAVFPQQVPLQVNRVQVSGLNRTKNDIVVAQVRDILGATSLQNLLVESLQAVERLKQLKVFKFVSVVFDTDQESKGVQVVFYVKERSVFSLTVGATAGTQSGDASLQLSMPNVFGRAEQLSTVSGTSFPHWGHTLQLQFTKPYYKDINKVCSAVVGTTETKYPFSGYNEFQALSRVQLQSVSALGSHTLSWDYNWRQLYGLSHSVPLAVREQAGHSLKSSIKHTFEVDQRDDPLFPREGYRFKLSHEVAGLGGDVCFGKSELNSEFYRSLFNNWVFSLTLWGGVLRPLTPSRINDRFLLGGPSTLRGFGMWGAGPRRQGYSLGGEAYWGSGVHLYAPLPLFTNELLQRIRLHTFATAGNLIQCGYLSQLGGLARGVRCSCGVGLHFRLGIAQIELNYAIPIKAQPSDLLQPGLQFGIGMDML